jgi:hypothetical protein
LAADPLPEDQLSLILYCVLWHRKKIFTGRGTINIVDPVRTQRLAAILRVADALDRTLHQHVEDVNLHQEGRWLKAVIRSKSPVSIEIDKAKEKSDLMKQAFSLEEITFQHK